MNGTVGTAWVQTMSKHPNHVGLERLWNSPDASGYIVDTIVQSLAFRQRSEWSGEHDSSLYVVDIVADSESIEEFPSLLSCKVYGTGQTLATVE